MFQEPLQPVPHTQVVGAAHVPMAVAVAYIPLAVVAEQILMGRFRPGHLGQRHSLKQMLVPLPLLTGSIHA